MTSSSFAPDSAVVLLFTEARRPRSASTTSPSLIRAAPTPFCPQEGGRDLLEHSVMWGGSSERKVSAPLRKFSAFERFRRTPLVSVRSAGCHSVRYSSRRGLGFAQVWGLAACGRQ